MKKLIETSIKDLIVCDNPNCDFTIPSKTGDANEDIKRYVNVPCPKCGQNLLTEKDYLNSQKVMNIVNFINKYFSWLTIFSFRNSKKQTILVHAYNGIKIEKLNQKTMPDVYWELKNLDQLMEYLIELAGTNEDKELFIEGIKRYAEAYHQTMLKVNGVKDLNDVLIFDKEEVRLNLKAIKKLIYASRYKTERDEADYNKLITLQKKLLYVLKSKTK